MDQLYHTKCFTCHHCAINLQGKPFYALDGHPYCEEDYLVSVGCQVVPVENSLRASVFELPTLYFSFRIPWRSAVSAKNPSWIGY